MEFIGSLYEIVQKRAHTSFALYDPYRTNTITNDNRGQKLGQAYNI